MILLIMAWHFKEFVNAALRPMNSRSNTPVYAQISLNLITIALLATALYLGKGILVPFFFAILLATLLHPFVNFLTEKKLNRVVSILFAIVLALVVIATLVYFLSHQIGNFLDDIPALKERLRELLTVVKKWVQSNFNIAIRDQNEYLDDTAEKMSTDSPNLVQQTFITLTGVVSYIIFLPVYTFLILYHKEMIKRFLCDIFKRSEEDKIMEVLYEGQAISQRYLIGLLIECAIVFTLNSVGFLILGIRYPIFLALISALLNLVPYIGMLIANIFCMLITLVASDGDLNVLWVCAVLTAVQLIDNNVLMPFVVGSKIKINALAIILGVVTGGALCGVPGMFLAIPGLAVMKVVFERVDGLKPWALLLGDETTANLERKNPIKSAFSNMRKRVKKEVKH
jgi:predicted PurR-regulated permease PerM